MDKKFPKQIPVFPLSGVIYFPKTNLPLNIFEDRYLDLVNGLIKHSYFKKSLFIFVGPSDERYLVDKVFRLKKPYIFD